MQLLHASYELVPNSIKLHFISNSVGVCQSTNQLIAMTFSIGENFPLSGPVIWFLNCNCCPFITTVDQQKNKARKATGPDGLCRSPGRYIFNLSLERVPVLWKTSCDDPSPLVNPNEPNHYRLVAQTLRIFLNHLTSLVSPSHLEPGIRGGWHYDQPSAELPVSLGYWKYIFTADSSMWGCWMWWSGALDSPRKSTLYTWGYSYSIHSCHIQKFSNHITIVGMTVSEGRPQMKGDVDQLQQETLQYGSREHLGTWKRAQSVAAPLGSFKVEGEIRARAKPPPSQTTSSTIFIFQIQNNILSCIFYCGDENAFIFCIIYILSVRQCGAIHITHRVSDGSYSPAAVLTLWK